MRHFLRLTLAASLAITLASCYRMRGSSGGGETSFERLRRLNPADIALPAGYRIEPVAEGFTFPTGVAIDEKGVPYVLEAGYAYGEVWAAPRLIRVGANGAKTIVAEGGKNGPWTGVAYTDGVFYIAEGGELEGGRILKVSSAGRIEALVDGLPSNGDHHTNGPAIGPDGLVYFGQGTATNSGVVGEDNFAFGWAKRKPDFHDVPCADVTLKGVNFESGDPRGRDRASTGAFMPFGKTSTEGQVIRGEVPCSGSIMRINPAGGSPELVAWGFRNPFGLAFAKDGRLFATDNMYDERGSRPVFGAGDLLWEVREGGWYGWPDFHGNSRLDEHDHYKPPGRDKPVQLLKAHPNSPPRPAAIFPVHSSSDGMDFSSSPEFGYEGEAFVAQFGDEAPATGKVLSPVGFKVVRVDVENGTVRDFAVNGGDRNGPASLLKTGGLERPVSVRFGPDGRTLYIVDFGVMLHDNEGAKPKRDTGVLWKVTKEAAK